MSVDMGACISYGWERLKGNPGFMIVSFLVIALAQSFTVGILAGPIMVGFMRGLQKEDQGRQAEIGDLFSAFGDFVPALIAFYVSAFAVVIGFILCIIPGLLLAPMPWIALYLVAAGEKDGMAAVKRAWEIVTGNLVNLALTSFVIGLVGGLGQLACGVGVLATMPIAFGGWYKMAQTATGGSSAPKVTMGVPGMPPMGPPAGR